MTDKLEKLEELFRSQEVTPRDEAKSNAVSSAMEAFELEKSSGVLQAVSYTHLTLPTKA